MGERPKGDNVGESELRRRVGLQAEENATDECRESETRPALWGKKKVGELSIGRMGQ